MGVAMPYRLTGAGAWGFSVNWEKVAGDEQIAQKVITFLEDKRLLFGHISHMGHENYYLRSANETRHFLTSELFQAEAGKSLATSIKAIRAAMRRFVDAAGPGGRNFMDVGEGRDQLSLALGELRSSVGLQVALIAGHYGLEVEDDLAQILPPVPDDDPSVVPGFGEPQ
jgi:hypothetical protein